MSTVVAPLSVKEKRIKDVPTFVCAGGYLQFRWVLQCINAGFILQWHCGRLHQTKCTADCCIGTHCKRTDGEHRDKDDPQTLGSLGVYSDFLIAKDTFLLVLFFLLKLYVRCKVVGLILLNVHESTLNLQQCTPSHEQIGRPKIWEIAQLGYSTQLDPS